MNLFSVIKSKSKPNRNPQPNTKPNIYGMFEFRHSLKRRGEEEESEEDERRG